MSDYSWLGVLLSAGVTTLALLGWFVMAVPYFDNAPYLHELHDRSKLMYGIGLSLFALFFSMYYLGALYLNQDTSGPMIAFAAVIVALPVSMLIGTETWEHYNPKSLNRVGGTRAVAMATGLGLAELGGTALAFMFLFRIG
jgi:hypothetical protein